MKRPRIQPLSQIMGLVVGLATLLGNPMPQPGIYTLPATSHGARGRYLYVSDEGHLHLNAGASSGQLLVEEGSLTGQLPCRVKIRFYVGSVIDTNAVIYPRGDGTITIHGREQAHYSNHYASFGGTVSVSSGTGRYAQARGTGGFYGVVDRQTDAATVQTTGKLYY